MAKCNSVLFLSYEESGRFFQTTENTPLIRAIVEYSIVHLFYRLLMQWMNNKAGCKNSSTKAKNKRRIENKKASNANLHCFFSKMFNNTKILKECEKFREIIH